MVPLALDPLAARSCHELGFEAVYLSGGALGYRYAVSEALLTLTEVCDAARRIAGRSALPTRRTASLAPIDRLEIDV